MACEFAESSVNLKRQNLKVLILGIGNILFGDEGIGVHLSNFLKVNYAFKSREHSLQIIDGGTLAQALIPLITEQDFVILLDCINADNAQVGDVFAFDFSKVPLNVNWQGTAHEVEMLQTLRMIEMLGDLPTIKIVATIPHILDGDTSFELSQTIKDSAKIMQNEVFKILKSLEFEIEKIADLPLQDVANRSYLGF